MSEEKKQIFISYSSKDRKLVDTIVKQLKDLPVSFWCAPESISPGSNYAREIPKAIQESTLFLLMLSKNSQQSIWVEKEIDSAISQRIHIIPLQLDEEPMSDMFKFYLNNVQNVFYYENPKAGIQKVREQILRLLEASNKKDGKVITISEEDLRIEEHYNSNKVIEKIQKDNEAKLLERKRKSNVFRANRIPVSCENCGCSELTVTSIGEYTCKKCRHKNYDDFYKIRKYLHEVGSASVLTIIRETGIPRESVEGYIRERHAGDNNNQ